MAEFMTPKFKPGDRVVFTNDFGVCWGVKTITSIEPGFTDTDGPRYHYEGTETPWFPISERNLIEADYEDLILSGWYFGDWEHFQAKYGWTPTVEQLGGCY